jgi:hypothetical protein
MVVKITLILSLLASPALAGPPLTQSYKWFDGGKEFTVWLDPDYVAEYGPPGESTAEGKAVKTHAPSSTLHYRKGHTRVWKLGAPKLGAKGVAALNKIKTAAPAGKFSPVFRSAPTPLLSGQLTLPGGIIVKFKPDWSEQQIRDFANAHGLKVSRKSPAGHNIYVLSTEPGMQSLEKANALHFTGEVLNATPNWQEALKPL